MYLEPLVGQENKQHNATKLIHNSNLCLQCQISILLVELKALTVFNYPEICLRARDIQKVPRIDPKPVLVAFLQDLQKKMPRICGFPLKLHNKACYPSIDLYSVTQVEKQTAQNLTLKPPNKKIIFRNTDDIQKLVTRNINNLTNNCHQSSDFVVAQKTILKDAKIYTTDANINEEHHVNATLERNCTYGSNIEGSNLVTNRNQADLSVDDRHSMHLNSMPLLKFNEGQIQQDSIVDKIIPVFKSKDRRSDKLLQILPKSNAKVHPVVPVFKTKTLKASIVYPNEKTDMETSQLLRGQDTCQSKGTLQTTTTGFPDFNTSRNPNILKKPNFKSSVQRPEILKHYTQQNNVLASPRVNSNKSSVKAQSVQRDLNAALNSVPNIDRKTMKIPVPALQSAHLSKPYTTPVSTPLSHKGVLSQSPFQNVKNTPVIIPSTPKGNGYSLTAMSPGSTTQCFQKQVENISGLSSTPSTPGIKRPCPSSHEGTPVMKKPRPKQQVQDVNVEFLARSNQLNKVNTVTLVSWLKDKGVVCKSKDKKGDLVEKTLKLLNLTVSEQ